MKPPLIRNSLTRALEERGFPKEIAQELSRGRNFIGIYETDFDEPWYQDGPTAREILASAELSKKEIELLIMKINLNKKFYFLYQYLKKSRVIPQESSWRWWKKKIWVELLSPTTNISYYIAKIPNQSPTIKLVKINLDDLLLQLSLLNHLGMNPDDAQAIIKTILNPNYLFTEFWADSFGLDVGVGLLKDTQLIDNTFIYPAPGWINLQRDIPYWNIPSKIPAFNYPMGV